MIFFPFKSLEISSNPTVKKYYLMFEQEGYKFKRSNEGHILFSEHDISLFKELIHLKNQPEMTIQRLLSKL
jgi:hypothetical protein